MPALELLVPKGGQRSDLNEIELSLNDLRSCKNMMRDAKGRLSVRPGYAPISDVNPDSRIMGIHFFQTATGSLRMVAGTKTSIWQFDGTDWVNLAGTALAGTDVDHVRFTTYFEGGTYYMIATNGVNTMKEWDGSAMTYSAVGGTPGISIDVTVLANRLLALQYPNKVRISEFNNRSVWDAALDLLLIDSGDPMIGMQRVNRTSVAVLGLRSQWVLRSQSGNFPVKPERVSEFPGPVSSAAIVKAGSKLYYLSEDHNVYSFDGSTPANPVGWAMVPFVEANMHEDNFPMTHGVYIERLHKIFWIFPDALSSAPNVGIFLDVMTGEMGSLHFVYPITASGLVRILRAVPVTWNSLSGFTWDNIEDTYPTWNSFGGSGSSERVATFGDSLGVVHGIDRGNGSDDGAAIACEFEFPLKAYSGLDKNTVPKSYEGFFRKTSASTVVQSAMGYTDTLMEDPVYMSLESFDLALNQRNDIDLTSLSEKRFISLRHQITVTRGQLMYMGGVFDGEATEIAKGPENL